MESTLERQRKAHETLQRIERVATDELLKDVRTVSISFKRKTRDRVLIREKKQHKEKVIQEHLVAKLIQQSQQTADELVSLYDEAPQEPEASSSSKQAADPLTDAFNAFYEGVAQIDDWFRDYPDDAAQDLQISLPDAEDFEEGTMLIIVTTGTMC